MNGQIVYDSYEEDRMRIGLIILWMLTAATNASAESFNQHNIIAECSKDRSFYSPCYTYLAAYRDFLSFFVWATEAERIRALCILNLETERVANRLAQAEPLPSGYKVAELIMDEFCN